MCTTHVWQPHMCGKQIRDIEQTEPQSIPAWTGYCATRMNFLHTSAKNQKLQWNIVRNNHFFVNKCIDEPGTEALTCACVYRLRLYFSALTFRPDRTTASAFRKPGTRCWCEIHNGTYIYTVIQKKPAPLTLCHITLLFHNILSINFTKWLKK